MRPIILYIAASMDGFIAGPNHELDWLPENDFGDDFGYSDLLEEIDTTLMSGTTFDVVQKLAPGNPYPNLRNFVFTRDTTRPYFEGITWVSEDPITFVRHIRNQPGKAIWLVGGGKLNTQFLKAGMIDEIKLALFPVFLGKGISLFDGLDMRTWFDVKSARVHPSGAIIMNMLRK